jgi:hypothetical protein
MNLSLAKCGMPLQRVRDRKKNNKGRNQKREPKRRYLNNFKKRNWPSKQKPILEERGKPNS